MLSTSITKARLTIASGRPRFVALGDLEKPVCLMHEISWDELVTRAPAGCTAFEDLQMPQATPECHNQGCFPLAAPLASL